jgi:hypothetical protein
MILLKNQEFFNFNGLNFLENSLNINYNYGECIDEMIINSNRIGYAIAFEKTQLYFKYGILYGDITILDTMSGKIVQGLIKDGIPMFLIPRINGSLNKRNKIDVTEIITFDISHIEIDYSLFENIVESRKQKLNKLL